MSKSVAFIYVITCVVVTKTKVKVRVYVGSTKFTAAKRVSDHWWALDKQVHENPFLQKAWNKYGQDCFSWRVVETCGLNVRWDREQWWIDDLKACDSRFGFNLRHSVQKPLPSAVMSKRLKAYWKRRWQDEEYAELRSEELRNIVNKPGVRQKMSDKKRANWQDPNYRSLQVKKHQNYSRKSENRKRLSKQASSAWADPEYRARQMAERKRRFSDPAFIAKLSEAAKNRKDRRTRKEIV